MQNQRCSNQRGGKDAQLGQICALRANATVYARVLKWIVIGGVLLVCN
jgi:hypothetical protein